MTNEEILKAMHERGAAGYGTAMDLARSDEREKITEETVKEYFAGLNGKETALIVLNYLLRGGITDDDLRGLRLQWIKEQPEGVDVWVSWDDGHFEFPTVTTKQPKENRMKTFSPNEIGGKYYTDLGQNFTIKKGDAVKLGIKQGECAKFKIVRVE